MLDSADLAQFLVWGGLVAVGLAQARSSAKARARREAGIGHRACVRCGGGLRSDQVDDRSSLCVPCAAKLKRGYRAASWFAFGLGAFFAIMAPTTILREWRQFGDRSGFAEVGMFAGMIAASVGLGWLLRRAGATLL